MTTALTTRALQERVDRGVAYLDRTDPGWWKADQPGHGTDGGPINLDELSMKSSCYCVLGQRLGSFYRAEISLDEAVDYGFDAVGGVLNDEGGTDREALTDEFDALTELWTRVIDQRRAGVDLP